MNEPNEPNESAASDHSGLRRACLAVLFFYAFLLLLNGKGIHEGVSRLEYGPRRDFLMAATRPLAVLSERTRACRLRDGVEASAGNWLNGTE